MSSDKISEFNRESLRKIAREIVIRRYVLILHGWVYIFVNLLLVFINWFITGDYPWVLWSITAWAIILIFHGLTFFIFRMGIIHGGTIGIIYHLTAFLTGNIFLFFVAIFTAQPMWSYTSWFLWPLFGWSLGFAFHLLVYFYIAPKKNEDEYKGWIDRKIEKELQKLKEYRNNLQNQD